MSDRDPLADVLESEWERWGTWHDIAESARQHIATEIRAKADLYDDEGMRLAARIAAGGTDE